MTLFSTHPWLRATEEGFWRLVDHTKIRRFRVGDGWVGPMETDSSQYHSFTFLFKVFNLELSFCVPISPVQDPECCTHCPTSPSTVPGIANTRKKNLRLRTPRCPPFLGRAASEPARPPHHVPPDVKGTCLVFMQLSESCPCFSGLQILGSNNDTVGVNARGAGRMGLTMVGEVRPSPR